MDGIAETTLVISVDGVAVGGDVLRVVDEVADFCQTGVLVHPVPSHHPATPGPGRNALKRHWWWLMETVFDGSNGLLPASASNGVLFIEDDHVLSPDSVRGAGAVTAARRP